MSEKPTHPDGEPEIVEGKEKVTSVRAFLLRRLEKEGADIEELLTRIGNAVQQKPVVKPARIPKLTRLSDIEEGDK